MIYRIIVQEDSPICLKFAKFVNSNITALNHANVTLKIAIIDPENLSSEDVVLLKKYSITRFPVLIEEGKKPKIGLERCVEMLKGHLKQLKQQDIVGSMCSSDFERYQFEQCFGKDESGYLAPRGDPEESEQGMRDPGRAMAEFQSRRRLPAPPGNRKGPSRGIVPQEPVDNIGGHLDPEQEEYPARRGATTAGAHPEPKYDIPMEGEEDLHTQMLRALMNDTSH